MYTLYIVKCADNTLYTGITSELSRRIKEHNFSKKGAKYTRIRRPVELIYTEEYTNRSLASKREYEIKKHMSREDKFKLIALEKSLDSL